LINAWYVQGQDKLEQYISRILLKGDARYGLGQTNMAVEVVAFWVVTPHNLIGGYQYFRGTYCLHLQREVCRVRSLLVLWEG
jgi:hypothetical protein